MRNRYVVFFAGLALSATMLAQTAPAPGTTGNRARGPERIFQRLNLTDDQKSKVQSVLQSERTQIQSIRSNTSLTEEQKKQQVRELRKNDHQQMLAILTPEQQAQQQQMREQHQGNEGRFNGGRGLQALNLTPEQKSQLKPIFESTRQQMQALRTDTSLTPEQKHEKMQQIRQNQMTQMKSILTPEQLQQLQQWRGRGKHRGGEQQQTPRSV